MASKIVAALMTVFVGAVGASDLTQTADDYPRVALFGFALINTSIEATRPVEEARLQMLDELLRERLDASGRFRIVSIPTSLQEEIARGPDIRNCNGCERDFAQKIGADLAAWGTVQKVSNLILNINLYIENARTRKMEFARSVDIRGNTDESWRRGLDYMIRHYLFNEP